jgi:MFS family permease
MGRVFAAIIGFVVGGAVFGVWSHFTHHESWADSFVSGLVFAILVLIAESAGKLATHKVRPTWRDEDEAGGSAAEQREDERPKGIDISWLPTFVGPAVAFIFMIKSFRDGEPLFAVVWLAFALGYVMVVRFAKRRRSVRQWK